MFNKITSLFLLVAFSFNTIAKPIENASKIDKIMKKYDYLLTSHADSHKADFRKSTLENYKSDIQTALSNASKEELDASFQELVKQIPTQEKREAYLKVLNNSNQDQLATYLTDPTLLADALRGESANFFTNLSGTDVLLIILGAVIVTVLIIAIAKGIKYQYFYSSFFLRAPNCTYDSLVRYNYPSDIDASINSAANRCESRANNPGSCQFDGWDYQEVQTFDGYIDCDIRARYKAER